MLQDDLRIPPPGYRSAPQQRAAESRRMLLAAGGVGGVLILAVVAYFVASGGGSQTIPVIQPAAGPVKVRPANAGGLQVNTQTSALLGAGGSGVDANLAPAPETPDPAALAAAATQEQTSAAAPRTASASSGSAVAAVAAPNAVAIPSIPETSAPATQNAPQRAAMNVPPPSPAAAAVHNLMKGYKPAPQFTDHGPVRVQLAALDSRDAALREWDHLTHRMPSLFDGRRPIFEEAHVDGHSFWRVRTTGFASVSDAKHFCDDVHARGAACTVAAF